MRMRIHGLAAAATIAVLPGMSPAWASAFVYDASTATYTVPPGTYGTLSDIYLSTGTNAANQGNFTVAATSSVTEAIVVSTVTGQATSGPVNYSFSDTAPILLSVASGLPSSAVYDAIYLQSRAVAGNSGNPPQGGGNTGTITATVSGTSVTANTSPGAVFGGLYAMRLDTTGVSGGDSSKKSVDGGTGGQAGAVTLTLSNSSASASSLGSGPGAAVSVLQRGGTGGQGEDSSSGGVGGTALALNLAATDSTISGSGAAINGLTSSQVGGTGGAAHSSGSGGTGGVTGNSAVTLTRTAITTNGTGAVGALIQQAGGAGGIADTSSTAGRGGATGTMAATITDSTVSATGAGAKGLFFSQAGGAGGTGGIADQKDHSNGNTGGDGNGVAINLTQSGAGNAITVANTTGSKAPKAAGLLVQVTGGNGGDGAGTGGGLQIGVSGGNGGDGGNAGGASGSLTLTFSGTQRVVTTGDNATGIAAIGQGGQGGVGGNVASLADSAPGAGGSGGRGSPISVNLGTGLTVTTAGASSPAVVGQSFGGQGGVSGAVNSNFGGGGGGKDAGPGGNSGVVTVTLGSVILRTSGAQSPGLFVQSVSGAGGTAGRDSGGFFYGSGGNGGNGGAAGGASVTSAATINTSGAGSRGILVQTISGPGGAGGDASGGIVGSSGGNGGTSGSVGAQTVTNTGTIATTGSGAQGILVQSLAGGGGTGGNSDGLIYASSGAGSGNFAASNGGAVTVSQTGVIGTVGSGAAAVMAQSIGGGGGDGGPSSGVLYAHGGDGGAGGTGGAVTVTLGGSLSTAGSLSAGLTAQSVGGTGGNGGNVQAASAGATYVVGGSAGTGGAGGIVSVTSNPGSITTTGTGAQGLIAQSIGGGGGTGGAAYAISVGIQASFAAAVGGSGGDGGAGGGVTVNTSGTAIRTGLSLASAAFPVDAIGIVAQSVGGGGGIGGGASANAIAVALPSLDPDPEVKTVTVTATYAAGGSGGSGGNGGAVTLGLGYNGGGGGGSTIATAGAGSLGALVQSIGGGGGQGGDASALAATIGSAGKFSNLTGGTQTQTIDVAVGAKGGSGGSGGAAALTVGVDNGSTANQVRVSTTGDYASALVVQSIGGGGGNAGVGSASVTSAGKVSTQKYTLALGASGGTGGQGGNVTVNVYSSSQISTAGSGAIGLLAQSIGGGGGTSTGGTLNMNGLAEKELTPNASLSASGTISIGATGGSGNNAGTIFLYNQGRITTVANDAPAIVAQSIGGGGGVGGSAGSDAATSGDSSESAAAATPQLLALAAATGNPITPSFTLETNLSLNLGGKGGAAGNGNAINLTQGGTLATSGDFSPGVIAQSIGGGGGRGGVAVAGGESNSVKSILASGFVNSAVSLGASGGGGSGGSGGAVTVSLLGGSISTGLRGTGSAGTGLQSFGVLAQSIGGGGGIGADGTTEPNGAFFLGAGLAGGGGAAGNGSTVTLNQGATGTAAIIQTLGDAAHGVVLQSVGGGGGVGGGGAALTGGTAFYAPTVNLWLGGSGGSSGAGGSATVDNPILSIATAGAGSFGLVAQSLGGGGGIASFSGAPVTIRALGAASGSGGNGGTVSVTLPTTTVITTTGPGAHGLVAQSVGGGGGIATSYAAGTIPLFSTAAQTVASSGGYGTGGPVAVVSQGTVITTGAGAFGIVAQSVGGGGGLATSGGTLYAGSTNPTVNSGSAGGAVTVDLQGIVSAGGANAYGVFAQSASSGGAVGGLVGVALGYFAPATVTGGSGAGAGVLIDGGSRTNTLSVGQGSSLSALSGVAVRQTGTGLLNVVNDGIISGSTYLGGGGLSGTGVNTVQADSVAPAANGTLTNRGTLVPVGQSVIQGNLVQTATGRIATTADFATGQVGRLDVSGNASLAGQVVPTLATILPGVRLPVLTVTGTATGRLTVPDTALFGFQVQQTGNRFDLVATSARFADGRFGLSAGRTSVAYGLQSVFDSGSAPGFGTVFAALDQVAGTQPAEYARRLGQLSPRTALGLGARRAQDAASIANASMSCPVFAATSAFLTEGSCAYFKPGIRTTSDGGDADRGHLQLDSATWQIGGQQEIAPGLFLGGSLAYERSWLNADDGVKGSGSSGQGAVTLKYQTGPWLFTGAAFGSAGNTDLQRVIDVPGTSGVAKGSPSNATAGLRARVAYTVGTESLYLRPYLNIDGLYAHTGAYDEYGAGAFGLGFAGASQTTAVVTPAVEVGTRVVMGPTTVLRGYISAGASVRTNDTWRASARLLGAPGSSGWFSTAVPQDRAAARIGAGVQLFQGDRMDLRAQYDGEYGGRATTHGGTLTFAFRL